MERFKYKPKSSIFFNVRAFPLIHVLLNNIGII